MKKIFTLISMALVAMSVNAQTPEIWHASSVDLTEACKGGVDNNATGLKKVSTTYSSDPFDGKEKDVATAEVIGAADAQNTQKDYIITGETASMTMKAVATPNNDKEEGNADIWKFAGADNQKLNSTNLGDECLVEFDEQYLLAGTGNPTLVSVEYKFLNSENKEVGPRYAETPWTPGCNALPAKGCYYKFEAKADGKLVIGFFLNKNLASNPLYIVDGSTKNLIAKEKISIVGFRQNCNFETEQGGTTKLAEYALDDNYNVVVVNGGGTNRPLYGYITLDVTANGEYYMFSPQSQMGVYGFEFTAGSGTGISNVKAAEQNNANAPIYNLAGQKVEKSQKGVLIQNGKKFVNK